MKMSLAVLAIFASTASVSTSADIYHETSRSLKGVHAFALVIGQLQNDAPVGVTEENLKTDVVMRLTKAGIPIIEASPHRAYIYVNLNTARIPSPLSGYYAYAIGVEVRQIVSLERDPTISTDAATWRTGGVGLNDSAKAIRADLDGYIDQFVSAYLAANPNRYVR